MNKLMIAATAFVALTSVAAPALAMNIIRGKDSPNYPNRHNNVSNFDCGTEFGHFKRVLPAQVAGIDDGYRVWVTPVCIGGELMRSEGNAAYLRTSIADNEVLVDALDHMSYSPEDVFAVKMMGDDTINLYVHDFAH